MLKFANNAIQFFTGNENKQKSVNYQFEAMASINFKILKSILLIFLLPIYGVKTITEEELAPFFETFKQQMFQQILKATKDIPDIVTAIQGTEVISRLLSKAIHFHYSVVHDL